MRRAASDSIDVSSISVAKYGPGSQIRYRRIPEIRREIARRQLAEQLLEKETAVEMLSISVSQICVIFVSPINSGKWSIRPASVADISSAFAF
jgi:hypothetical protein